MRSDTALLRSVRRKQFASQRQHFRTRACAGSQSTARRAERAIDMLRNARVWDVEMLAQNGKCHWRAIVDAASGKLLNVSDLVDRAYTDAKVNRWSYPSGDLFNPQQVVSSGNLYAE